MMADYRGLVFYLKAQAVVKGVDFHLHITRTSGYEICTRDP